MSALLVEVERDGPGGDQRGLLNPFGNTDGNLRLTMTVENDSVAVEQIHTARQGRSRDVAEITRPVNQGEYQDHLVGQWGASADVDAD